MFACWPLGTLQWIPPCLEKYNSLDHSLALLLYCVCVGEHGVEMYLFPSSLWHSWEHRLEKGVIDLM